ncbi:DNA-3-methyladenine glycosylase 2 family protein [Patescibacteria group bacterium]|nr:DNA-3-methyladenine glycosylase 2 family protein [Patescibacteria group bacterium]MBU2080582.1 DNA-3-methyladenine glycosylase 2 family protein [Patescibacteria group bacterium]MBU2330213.1 DNA-3-methyladenine glycosylase 2 family protein [Patescibacteria group bacterium]
MSVKKVNAVDAAMLHLKQVDPVLYAAALPHVAHLRGKAVRRWKTDNALFAELASSVTGQQLSTKAADTIWQRLVLACKGEVTPEAISKLRVPTLRKAGLSAAKGKTLKELAKAVQAKELDLSLLKKLPEEEAIIQLSSVWGIGRWTAEMFLMFALHREDVFSPGDLGLRRSIEQLYGLEKDVHQKELEAISVLWSPHRTFASRVLWRVRDDL